MTALFRLTLIDLLFDYVMLSGATLAPRCVAVQVSISTTENQDSSLCSHRPDAFRESDKL
jgi:hypothetical protein